MSWLARVQTGQEVGHLVRERMLVANLQTRYPPMAHVGLIAIGDMHAAPAANDRFVAVVEVLQAMQVVQIPTHAGMFAVDFERVERLVAASITRRFEQSERTVVRNGTGSAGIIDPDRLLLASFGVHAFFDKGFGHGRDIFDRAVEPQGGVDAVGQQVAGHTAAGRLGIQSPSRRATLRYIGIDRPVLQEVGTIVKDTSELSRVDDLLGQGDGGTRR